jgi:hypothetical protein
MNGEIFSEWLKRQGHRVYRTESSYWYNAGPMVLQAFPYNWLVTPDESEIHHLMLKYGILALRFSAPLDYNKGKISYHIVLDKCYDLQMLKSQARNGVKTGLKNFSVEEISFGRLAREGWILQEDTLIRQNRSGSMSKKKWELLCHSAKDLPGFHAFAAISGKELAAALIVCRINDTYTVPYAMSHCRFLNGHVNNALFFYVTCELLKREGVRGIFYTVQSLDAPESVDEFKLRMGFEPKIIRQNVVIHPFLKPFITPMFYSLNRKLHQYYPANSLLSKSEGILRFYIEGRLPLREQNCPTCIKESMHMLESNVKNV